MSYETGSYLKELLEEHRRGEHTELNSGSANCPACDEEDHGPDDAHDAVMETALYLESHRTNHTKGAHKATSHDECIDCINENRKPRS